MVLPDYLSGRIPADDPGSGLEVVTTKILGYERRAPFGEYRNSAVLMADDDAKGLNDDPIGWLHVEQTDSLDVNHTPLQIDRECLLQALLDEIGEFEVLEKHVEELFLG